MKIMLHPGRLIRPPDVVSTSLFRTSACRQHALLPACPIHRLQPPRRKQKLARVGAHRANGEWVCAVQETALDGGPVLLRELHDCRIAVVYQLVDHLRFPRGSALFHSCSKPDGGAGRGSPAGLAMRRCLRRSWAPRPPAR